MWVRWITRSVNWATGIYALLIATGFDLADFGATEHIQLMVLKYMAIGSTTSSIISRFIGEKPVKFDTDKPEPPAYK